MFEFVSKSFHHKICFQMYFVLFIYEQTIGEIGGKMKKNSQEIDDALWLSRLKRPAEPASCRTSNVQAWTILATFYELSLPSSI